MAQSNLAWPRAGHFNRALVNSATSAVYANTSFNVYLADGTTAATIYSDRDKSSTVSQPLTTDASGNAEFWTNPYSGLVLKIGATGEKVDVLPDVDDLIANFFSDGGLNTSYPLSGADNMKILGFLAGISSGNLDITVPNNLPKNFSCEILHEGSGTATIRFVAASGATLNAFNVVSTSAVHHPGPSAFCSLLCRFNGSGTGAVVVIGNGVT